MKSSVWYSGSCILADSIEEYVLKIDKKLWIWRFSLELSALLDLCFYIEYINFKI